MALHLESITSEKLTHEEYTELGKNAVLTARDCYQPIPPLYHFRTDMIDRNTGELIGLFVTSLYADAAENRNVILDEDIIFPCEQGVKLRLLRKIGEASFADQLYTAVLPGTDYPPFWVETVNRFTVAPQLEGKEVEGTITFYPEQISCFENMTALNHAYGAPFHIDKPGLEELGLTDFGYSDRFMTVVEGYPKLFGTVISVREICSSIGDLELKFSLIYARTALGIIAIPIKMELFDIEKIEPGNALDLAGIISLDLSQKTRFTQLRDNEENSNETKNPSDS